MTYLETVEEKARRFADTPGRVVLHSMDRATVHGDTAEYAVTASPMGVSCTCRAWRPNRVCSHVIACQLVWAERIQEAAAS